MDLLCDDLVIDPLCEDHEGSSLWAGLFDGGRDDDLVIDTDALHETHHFSNHESALSTPSSASSVSSDGMFSHRSSGGSVSESTGTVATHSTAHDDCGTGSEQVHTSTASRPKRKLQTPQRLMESQGKNKEEPHRVRNHRNLRRRVQKNPDDVEAAAFQSGNRKFLPASATARLNAWLYHEDHIDAPYPTEEEKERLSEECGITVKQLTNWFTNARKRVWAPMMMASGREIINRANRSRIVLRVTEKQTVEDDDNSSSDDESSQ